MKIVSGSMRTATGKKHELEGTAKSPLSRLWNASRRVLRNGIYLCGGFDSLPVAKADYWIALKNASGRWQFWSAISLLRTMRVKKRSKKGFCRMCGTVGATEIHHVYPGAYRLKSDKNDFVIELCHACHMSIHDDPEKMRALKESTQKAFEKQHSHEEFVRRMGRSWL